MVPEIKHDAEHRMAGAIDALHRELAGIRTGRAAPGLVERLSVDYYGTATPLNQIAGVSAPEARLLVIQPWDRSSLGAIERAIQKSDLGLTPNNDGVVIRLAIPSLTEERRKALVKVVRGKVEESKVAIRNVRRDAVDHLKGLLKDKEIGEDDERRAQTDIDSLTKRFTDDADHIGQAKEAEILEV
ncbi:MAG TPA: ribosome recycling factor [Thermomicrobiales bacterium]|nr:ribosome recycling factor [Thermomicrobiales bacterium]HQZ89755.1 ribosome recycling factor [Thermomicrobiales bacterium]HRA32844.1 ribosome recycling factor [Thermomicrobiales bacterium]